MENKKLIDKAIRFIQENPKTNLSLQNIAENAGFSLTYFDTVFRSHTGYSPVEYSRIYKLTRSALELRRTKKLFLKFLLISDMRVPKVLHGHLRIFTVFLRVNTGKGVRMNL